MELVEELIHLAVKESECVALFTICLLLLLALHLSNMKRLETIQRALEEHKNAGPNAGE